MDLLYLKIADTFKNNEQVFIDRNLPPVRQVDVYMGQPDDPENFEVFMPSVFVDWNISEGTEKDIDFMQVDFHVLQEPGTGTEHYSERLTESMEYIRMLKAVKYLVNKLSSDDTTALQYIGERPRITPFFKYHVISYKCNVNDTDESIHRPSTQNVTLTGYDLTEGRIKPKQEPEEAPVIDTFKVKTL